MNTTDGLRRAALEHLDLVRRDPLAALDGYYVRLAFKYGIEVDQISDRSGIPLDRVRRYLGGR